MENLFYITDRTGRIWSGDFYEFLHGDDFSVEFSEEAEAVEVADRVGGEVVSFSRPSARMSSFPILVAAE